MLLTRLGISNTAISVVPFIYLTISHLADSYYVWFQLIVIDVFDLISSFAFSHTKFWM